MMDQGMNRSSPKDVGVIGMEIYFPSTCVDQKDLEKHDKVSAGKYTIGLGQTAMSFVNDREDVNSISLTCLNNLMKKYNVRPEQIGRLEVGTETLLDKSKSLKTVLMNLFKESGNHDVEGVTSINACYGSTNALFNSINWIQSDSWDGRYAVLISSDVAVYPKGNARPTGGVGAIAMLLGPNAHLVFDRCRSTFMDHRYDFYKPDPFSEYPTVDGHESIEIYLNALRESFKTFKQKYSTFQNGAKISMNHFDYFCFHTPFCKMVQKSFLAMVIEDIKALDGASTAASTSYDKDLVSEIKKNQFKLTSQTSKILLKDKQVGTLWKNNCERSLYLAKMLGNIYTGSLYNGLLSLVTDKSIDLSGKKLMLFSYGSGCASSMFMVHVRSSYNRAGSLQDQCQFQQRIDSRISIDPAHYEKMMERRESLFGKKDYVPMDAIDHLQRGTFYLSKVDENFRRFYEIKGADADDLKRQKHYNWHGSLKSQKTAGNATYHTANMVIVDDSKYQEISAQQSQNTLIRRLNMFDNHFNKF